MTTRHASILLALFSVSALSGCGIAPIYDRDGDIAAYVGGVRIPANGVSAEQVGVVLGKGLAAAGIPGGEWFGQAIGGIAALLGVGGVGLGVHAHAKRSGERHGWDEALASRATGSSA